MKRKPKNRNPVAKAVRRIRPKVVPDRRRKLLAKAEEQPTLSWFSFRHDAILTNTLAMGR